MFMFLLWWVGYDWFRFSLPISNLFLSASWSLLPYIALRTFWRRETPSLAGTQWHILFSKRLSSTVVNWSNHNDRLDSILSIAVSSTSLMMSLLTWYTLYTKQLLCQKSVTNASSLRILAYVAQRVDPISVDTVYVRVVHNFFPCKEKRFIAKFLCAAYIV